jgi:ABC-type polysaccharide/polyol phosphate export permease
MISKEGLSSLEKRQERISNTSFFITIGHIVVVILLLWIKPAGIGNLVSLLFLTGAFFTVISLMSTCMAILCRKLRNRKRE